MFTAEKYVVNVRKSTSRQRRNVTGFSMENAENVWMNPVPAMGFFKNFVKRMRGKMIMKKGAETLNI